MALNCRLVLLHGWVVVSVSHGWLHLLSPLHLHVMGPHTHTGLGGDHHCRGSWEREASLIYNPSPCPGRPPFASSHPVPGLCHSLPFSSPPSSPSFLSPYPSPSLPSPLLLPLLSFSCLLFSPSLPLLFLPSHADISVCDIPAVCTLPGDQSCRRTCHQQVRSAIELTLSLADMPSIGKVGHWTNAFTGWYAINSYQKWKCFLWTIFDCIPLVFSSNFVYIHEPKHSALHTEIHYTQNTLYMHTIGTHTLSVCSVFSPCVCLYLLMIVRSNKWDNWDIQNCVARSRLSVSPQISVALPKWVCAC